MLRPRIIPVLLLKNRGLVKTLRFSEPKYIGDPINAVKIFNEKEVDEIIILDIDATLENRLPDITYISEIGSECFMPFSYGGGIRSIDQIRQILRAGAEKICINSMAIENSEFIKRAAKTFGSQSIVISVDVKKENEYYKIMVKNKLEDIIDLIEYVHQIEKLGAGEILINSVDHDGTMKGYDVQLIQMVSEAVNIPVIACGGAGMLDDFRKAIYLGMASAAAAGSYFVFCGSRDAILITYPDKNELEMIVNQ